MTVDITKDSNLFPSRIFLDSLLCSFQNCIGKSLALIVMESLPLQICCPPEQGYYCPADEEPRKTVADLIRTEMFHYAKSNMALVNIYIKVSKIKIST